MFKTQNYQCKYFTQVDIANVDLLKYHNTKLILKLN